MKLATEIPGKAQTGLMITFFSIGTLLLVISITCLIRKSHRQNTLHLDGTNYLATQHIDQQKAMKAKMDNQTKTN